MGDYRLLKVQALRISHSEGTPENHGIFVLKLRRPFKKVDDNV